MGGGAGAKDARDFGFFNELFYVVHNWVFDAGVACAHDGAAVQNIPQGDVMLFEHGLLLRDGFGGAFGEFLAEHDCHDFPESILRVPVVECHFARFGRGYGAEQQHAGFAVV